jgi:hypothetical protein
MLRNIGEDDGIGMPRTTMPWSFTEPDSQTRLPWSLAERYEAHQRPGLDEHRGAG